MLQVWMAPGNCPTTLGRAQPAGGDERAPDAASPWAGAADRGLAPALVVKGPMVSKETTRMAPSSKGGPGVRACRCAAAGRGCHRWMEGPLCSIGSG